MKVSSNKVGGKFHIPQLCHSDEAHRQEDQHFISPVNSEGHFNLVCKDWEAVQPHLQFKPKYPQYLTGGKPFVLNHRVLSGAGHHTQRTLQGLESRLRDSSVISSTSPCHATPIQVHKDPTHDRAWPTKSRINRRSIQNRRHYKGRCKEECQRESKEKQEMRLQPPAEGIWEGRSKWNKVEARLVV